MRSRIFKAAAFAAVLALVGHTSARAQRTDSSKNEVISIKVNPLQFAKVFTPIESFPGFDFNMPQDSTYRKEYRKLQEQMNNLRTKMGKLRAEEMQKNAKRFEEMRSKMDAKGFEKLQGFRFENNVSGAIKGLGVESFGKTFYYQGGKGDDYLKKKIESGEVKEKVKNFSKSYAIDANDKIAIDNTYGKVTVNTWAKNEVKVDVQIKADADDDDAAQKLLDGVKISDSKADNTVSFRTDIESTNRNNGFFTFSSGRSSVRKVTVDYVVYMPAKSSVSINNRFGAVRLPDLNGKVFLKLSNGTLNAKELSNPQNDITVSFGDANIEALNSQSVKVSYGKLNVGTADNLKAKLSFSTGNVDKLRSGGDIYVRYGEGVKVGQLTNVKNLNVDAAFTKVLVNVKDDYDFDVNTKMASFNYSDNNAVKVTETSPAEGRSYTTSKTYKGKIGKGNPDKTITIKSTYGGVKFDEP